MLNVDAIMSLFLPLCHWLDWRTRNSTSFSVPNFYCKSSKHTLHQVALPVELHSPNVLSPFLQHPWSPCIERPSAMRNIILLILCWMRQNYSSPPSYFGTWKQCGFYYVGWCDQLEWSSKFWVSNRGHCKIVIIFPNCSINQLRVVTILVGWPILRSIGNSSKQRFFNFCLIKMAENAPDPHCGGALLDIRAPQIHFGHSYQTENNRWEFIGERRCESGEEFLTGQKYESRINEDKYKLWQLCLNLRNCPTRVCSRGSEMLENKSSWCVK